MGEESQRILIRLEKSGNFTQYTGKNQEILIKNLKKTGEIREICQPEKGKISDICHLNFKKKL